MLEILVLSEIDESLWEGYEDWLNRQALNDWFDEQAARNDYERNLEI